MRLTACSCRAEHYQRIGRAWWMKPFWTRRLYHCFGCDAVLLLAPENVYRRLDNQKRIDMQRAFAPTDTMVYEPAGRRASRREKPA